MTQLGALALNPLFSSPSHLSLSVSHQFLTISRLWAVPIELLAGLRKNYRNIRLLPCIGIFFCWRPSCCMLASLLWLASLYCSTHSLQLLALFLASLLLLSPLMFAGIPAIADTVADILLLLASLHDVTGCLLFVPSAVYVCDVVSAAILAVGSLQ